MSHELLSNEQLQLWVKEASNKKALYVAIMQDFDDREFFPVYFEFYSDFQRYQNNVISESKIKFIDLIKLSNYS